MIYIFSNMIYCSNPVIKIFHAYGIAF
jgi:hypothetical protein